MEQEFDGIGMKVMLLNARRLVQGFDQDASILLAIEDITEHKRADDQLHQYAAELSAADRRKNEFLAMLAHELRNPLAPIRNALQILRLTGGDGPAVDSASEMMERQVGQMVRLVDDLLDVSRISRGKIELRKGRVELASVVQPRRRSRPPAVESMDHRTDGHAAAAADLPERRPGPTGSGGGQPAQQRLQVHRQGRSHLARRVEREGEQAVIRVRDSGIGIAADQLAPHLRHVHAGRYLAGASVSGLGIGLTLVKNLVEMHGGTVEVHSAGVGQGSEFVVRLPILAEAPEPPPQPTVERADADDGPPHPRCR